MGSPTDIARHLAHPICVKEPMLDWWRGHYDHVFIALHPFVRVPAWWAWGQPDANATYKFAPTLSWADVAEDIGAAFQPFSVALVMAAHGLPAARRSIEPPADQGLIDRLVAYCEANGVVTPQTDQPSLAIHRGIADAFRAIGAGAVRCHSQWRDEEALISTDELSGDQAIDDLVGFPVYAFSDLHRRMLVSSDFDKVDTLIGMTGEARAKIRPEERFEGFYAGQQTQDDWVKHPETVNAPDWAVEGSA